MPFDGKNFPAVETDQTLRVLNAAREWLSDPAHWQKGDIFGMNGQTCAVGALEKFGGPEWFGHRHLVKAAGGDSVVEFNDDSETTHADILALFDRAIAARRSELAA